MLDEQNADTHHNAGTVGVAGGLEADDDSVIRLAQIDDPQVVEIDQTRSTSSMSSSGWRSTTTPSLAKPKPTTVGEGLTRLELQYPILLVVDCHDTHHPTRENFRLDPATTRPSRSSQTRRVRNRIRMHMAKPAWFEQAGNLRSIMELS